MRGSRRRGAFALVVASLTGCAAYVPRPIDPAVTAASLEARRLDAPGVLSFVAAMSPALGAQARAGHWNEASLTLAALYYHPDLEIERANIDEAAAGVVTAGEWANPTVTLSPTKHTSPLDPPWTVGAAIDLLLENFGKRAARQDAAAAAADAVRSDLTAAEWRIRDDIGSAALALQGAEAKAGVAAERQDLQREMLALTEQRHRNDAASGTDVAREQATLGGYDLAVTAATNDIASARRILATAIGIPTSAVADIELGAVASDIPLDDPALAEETLRRTALTGRGDVQGLLARYREAEAGLRLEIARQFPDFHLAPVYAYQEQDNEYVFSVSAELPILNHNEGPIGEAEARRRAAAARLLALQARVLGDVDGAFIGFQAATRSLAAADALSETEDRERQRVEDSFKAGQADRVALVAARLDATTEEVTHLDAVIERRRAADALEAALQQPIFDADGDVFRKALETKLVARS